MATITSPYRPSGEWLRGNLHTHTTFSDGTRPPEEIIADYESRGYDYLAISDHDVFVDPETYRHRTDMVLLPAVEVSANGPHILHINATDAVEPREDRQAVVTDIVGQGAFAVMNHPNWLRHFSHCPQETLEQVEGYAGIEIYNGVIERLPGSSLATDRWDRLLAEGRRIWGFGTDDCHRPEDVGLGWSVVQADERTPEAVVDSLRTGRFYASTGVAIERIGASEDVVSLTTANAQRIRLISDYGVVQHTVDGHEATFRISDHLLLGADHTYVRIECYGPGGRMAWTQPFFLS